MYCYIHDKGDYKAYVAQEVPQEGDYMTEITETEYRAALEKIGKDKE